MAGWDQTYGAPLPLGSQWIDAEQAYNFSVYSRHATAITLLLFEPASLAVPSRTIPLDYIRHKTGRVWHTRIARADIGTATYYGYQADGAFTPAQGDRFDASKVLLDPYARGVIFPPGYSRDDSAGPGSNAGRGPLGEIATTGGAFDWGTDNHPSHTHDTVIYEMHIRGLTKRENSGVSDAGRGTFAGVVEKIPYLRELGVTVVELLPVHQFDPEDGGNYWGYMPLSFFAPHRDYASASDGAGRLDEFRAMVKALHAAGIEVVLDVVYNHTSEVGADGPTYCYRGLDNGTYYLLQSDGQYQNDAGTGNVLRTAHPAVRKLIADSLRFWTKDMHVDGFRFDLAAVFTRADDGSVYMTDPPILAEIRSEER